MAALARGTAAKAEGYERHGNRWPDRACFRGGGIINRLIHFKDFWRLVAVNASAPPRGDRRVNVLPYVTGLARADDDERMIIAVQTRIRVMTD